MTTRAPSPIGAGVRTAGAVDVAPYRYDIDGLRAVAVLLVVIYHVWFDRVSGGVDVFLMLSAFFLTGSFVRRVESGSALALGSYWVRTFKRLLPAAAVTILGVLALERWLYPPSSWPTVWDQAWASLLYVQNWFLAASAVDYYAPEDALTSPLQHFWSLSVQGQVFVLWPLLIAGTALIARALTVDVRAALVVVFGAVFATSLWFSVVETTTNQQLAYFDTRTRLWEFALGSLVALVLPWLRLRERWSHVLGATGVVGVVLCGLVLDVGGGFPGYLALWPTLCAAAVIVGGAADAGRGGVGRVLGSRPVRALGRDAYALYLVHWPVLITWLLVADRSEAGPRGGLLVVAVSLVLARVVSAGVELPLRRWRWADAGRARGLIVITFTVLVVAAPLGLWQHAETSKAARMSEGVTPGNPGATALLPGYSESPDIHTAPLVPAATALDDQWVALPERCPGALAPTDEQVAAQCASTESAGEQERTILVVGDSHAEQFMGALIPVAEERGWGLVSVLRGACNFGVGENKCAAYNERVLDYALELGPDAVMTIDTAAEVDGPGEQMVPGLDAVVDRLRSASIDVIGVRDNPRFSDDLYRCVEEHGPAAVECERPLDSALAAKDPAGALDAAEGYYPVDLTAQICPAGVCSAVVGNVAVYLDDNHLTWSYAQTLAPFMGEQLRAWASTS